MSEARVGIVLGLGLTQDLKRKIEVGEKYGSRFFHLFRFVLDGVVSGNGLGISDDKDAALPE